MYFTLLRNPSISSTISIEKQCSRFTVCSPNKTDGQNAACLHTLPMDLPTTDLVVAAPAALPAVERWTPPPADCDPLHRGRRIYGLTLSASAVRDMVVKWAAHAQVAIDRPTTFGAPSPVTCSTTMWIV